MHLCEDAVRGSLEDPQGELDQGMALVTTVTVGLQVNTEKKEVARWAICALHGVIRVCKGYSKRKMLQQRWALGA